MDSEGGIVFMKGIKRLFALILALCYAVLPLGALAANAQDISISVQWTDWSGAVRYSDPASPVSSDPAENRFWLTLPSDAPLTGLMLQIGDLTGSLAQFSPGPGDELVNAADAMGSLESQPVEIAAFSANGEYQGVYYLYLSYLPLQEQANVPPAVTVHYTDENGDPLLPDAVLVLEQGVHTVEAETIPGYVLLTPVSSFTVTVDQNGAYPSDITFAYTRVAVTGQATVHYVDEYGNPLLPDETLTFQEGQTPVYAPPVDGYTVQGPDSYTVNVDLNGTEPSEITFVYAREIITGTVTVHCVDEYGFPVQPDETLTFQEGQTPLFAPALDGYAVQGTDNYTVTVDRGGAYPSEITFVYARQAVYADVTVHYVDENGQALANDMIYTYDEGPHTVPAAMIDQYVVSGETAVTVNVDRDGAHPGEITFTYVRYVPPAQVTVHYVDGSGASLLPDAVLTLEGGSHTLNAEVIDGYVPDGPEALPVNVTLNGAEPSEVTFLYKREVLPVEVTVHYVDAEGNPLSPDTTQLAQPGSNIIYPTAAISADDYLLTGVSYVEVYVTEDGANPAEVTFTYQRAAKSAVVTVHYVDDLGAAIAPDTNISLEPGIRQVAPEAIIPLDEYALISEEYAVVIVDVNGASPSEVTFTYQRLVQPVSVTVHYVNDLGETIAPDTVQVFGEGGHQITPDAAISPDEYVLQEPVSYPITVTLDGGSVSEVTFTYRRAVYPADVTVHYTDGQGNAVASDTVQTLGEGSYVVFPQPQDLAENYYQPEGSPAFQDVTVDADGAHPGEVTFVYEYRAPSPVILPVRYLDEYSGAAVADETAVEAAAGTRVAVIAIEDQASAYSQVAEPETTGTRGANELEKIAVSAVPANLPENYTLVSDPLVYVTVDAEGRSNREEVVFLYRYEEAAPAPTEEPTPEPTEEPTEEPTVEPTEEPVEIPAETPLPGPVAVAVRYVDQDGADVASPSETLCGWGETQIAADPQDLKADYKLDGPETITVLVDENGASPAEAVFIYRYAPDAPAPKVALVNVKYLNPNGETFYSYTATCAEGQENRISLDWSQVDPAWGYELASAADVYVTVDNTGAADPAEAIFQFRNEVNAYVTVRFVDAQTGREVAAAQQHLCYVGSNTIIARPDGLEPNYVLDGPDSATVNLDSDGVLSPAQVEFRYLSLATATPLPHPPAYDTAMDAYFYPTGTSIRLRSTPTTAEDNIVGMVDSGDLGHALGQTVSLDGKVWYAVEIRGMMGYVSETVVRFLNDAELAALFGYTPEPTQVPTPAPTGIPDGAAIDRWGKTTAAVNFRKSADRNAERITELKKNTRVWVFSSQTVNGEKWYAVRANGVDGYLMADYVEVAGEAESAEIQAQLASPMATQTPPASPEPTVLPTPEPTQEPTEAPTEEPTPEPTAEPTEEPTPEATETPAPYKGYALTNGQAALRTGVSQTDDTILEMLPSQALIYVQSQTYVDGVPWVFAQAVGSGSLGFMLQSSLIPITNEEARPYLDQIQTTPAVTATAVPEQTEGYAMTLGDGVPMRNFPDTNGEIIMLLPYMAVADVRGQQYAGNAAWHLVQYGGMWGYIRQDQLRMMSAEEVQAYEETLLAGTPSPSPAPTPEPVTQESLSSYGHVQSTSGRVNLRSAPSTSSNAIRLLDNYAFALVLGKETNDEGTWYHVSQAGNEGYIRSDYFHVLTLGELSDFLQSSEYLNANSNSTATGSSSSEIQPVEDYNKTVWQNPALSASYEPFNPFVTPTPDPERLPTETPAPTQAPTATPEIAPVGPQDNLTPPDNVQQGGSPWPWVLLGLAVVGGGGAYYAFTVRQAEKRRQAMRAQQARQARSAAAAQPQMRAAQNNPGQAAARPSYPNQQTAPFMPPQGGSPKPAAPSSGSQPVSGQTQTFRPVTPASPAQPQVNQATQAFTPARADTQAYRPMQQTQVFGGQSLFEGMTDEDLEALAQDTQAFKPAPANSSDRGLNLNIKVAKVELEDLTPEQENIPAPTRKRVRRTERNKNLYDDNNNNNA